MASERRQPLPSLTTPEKRRHGTRLNCSPVSPRHASNGKFTSPPRTSTGPVTPTSPSSASDVSSRAVSPSQKASPLPDVETSNGTDRAQVTPSAQHTSTDLQDKPRNAVLPQNSSHLPINRYYQPPRRVSRAQVQKTRQAFTEWQKVVRQARKKGKLADEDRYHYKPFSSPSQIRLLAINPSDVPSGTVYCQLVIRDFDSTNEPPVYEALSYVWGDETANKEIQIASPTASRLDPHKPRENRRLHYDVHIGRFWKKLLIRPNLHSALQHLRDDKRTVYLWVDALCINQDDTAERNEQVRKMAQIYSRASNVCVWLGTGNLLSQTAFEFVPVLLAETYIDEHPDGQTFFESWYALAEVMRNRWFSRRQVIHISRYYMLSLTLSRWIIQEVALAREVSLHCGNQSLAWGDFAEAVDIFATHYDRINKLLQDPQLPNSGRELGSIQTGAQPLVKVINNYLRKSPAGVERLASLELLVSVLLSFEASEPRDTIYGVLSLAKDTFEGNPFLTLETEIKAIQPDYDKPIIEVLKEFIDFAIKTSESLDIICRHWAPVPQKRKVATNKEGRPMQKLMRRGTELTIREEYPSWIPSVSGSAFGTPLQALQGRQHGDNFVGTSDRRTYDATPKTRPLYEFKKVPNHEPMSDLDSPMSIDEENPLRIFVPPTTRPSAAENCEISVSAKPWWCMHVKGFRLDVIKHLAARVSAGVIQRECFELTGWKWPEHHDDVDIPEIPDEIWRTMVADRGPDGDNPPIFYQRACQKCLARSNNGDIEIKKLISTGRDVMVTDFLKRVEKVTWDRRFMRSEGKTFERKGNLQPKKLFGLAPPKARKRDIICILLGCSVPVILREHRSYPSAVGSPSHRPAESWFEFIGEAYIYGMMSGEALGGRRMEQLERECEWFELR